MTPVPPDRLYELVDGYLDGELGAEGLAALEADLLASPEARRLFWERAHQHALIGELLAEARGRRLAVQEQRSPADAVAAGAPPRRRSWAGWAGWTAVAVLLGLGLAWALRPGPAGGRSSGLARLADLEGDVRVFIDGAWLPARDGQALRAGQELHTGAGSRAVLAYDDLSRLELNADTAVRLLPRQKGPGAQSGKRVFLVQGVVSATVEAQPAGRPMVLSTEQGDLIAPKGRFSSASHGGELRVELEEGRALLSRKGDSRTVEMHTGSYAIAAADVPEVTPSPLPRARGGPLATLEAPAGPVVGLAVSSDGRWLANTTPSGEVMLWDVAGRHVHATLTHPRGKAVAVAYSRDGRHLAAGLEPRKGQRGPGAVVYDARSLAPRYDLPLRSRVAPVAFTPDGQSLALAGADRAGRGVYLWDIADRRERLLLGDRQGPPLCVAVAPNGRSLAAGYRDGQVVVWSLVTGRAEMTLSGHRRAVQSVAFAPGGRVLATGGADGAIRLWSMPRGQAGRVITGPFKEARCLAFSPDGRLLASGHGGTALLWEVATGEQREALRAHRFAVTALEFFRDGKTLASAGWDHFIKLWPVPPPAGRDPGRRRAN